MAYTGSKCDVCLGGEGQASASPQLLPLLTKHLGLLMRMKQVKACEACGQLLTLWDDFSQQARINLAISHPETVKNDAQYEKDKQPLQADNSTQSFPCDSTFVSPKVNEGDIPSSQIPTTPRTEICKNQELLEDGNNLKSIQQIPAAITESEENKVAYLRQIKLAPIDHQHVAKSNECCDQNKPSEACNDDASNNKTHETVTYIEEGVTSDYICKETQTSISTTDASREKSKTVQPMAISLLQSDDIQTSVSTTIENLDKFKTEQPSVITLSQFYGIPSQTPVSTTTIAHLDDKSKTVQPSAIPLPQSAGILTPSGVGDKHTSMDIVTSASNREEQNIEHTFVKTEIFGPAGNVTVQQNQTIFSVAKRAYANTTKIEYMNQGCLPCPTCTATLPSQKALHEHMMNSCLQNRNSQFICAFCSRQYNSKPGLSYHLMQHFTELSSIPCPVCKKIFTSYSALRKHKMVFHFGSQLPTQALIPCVFCHLVFCESALMNHYVNCQQNNLVVSITKCNIAEQHSSFTCSYCYKIFINKLDLLHHMESFHMVVYYSNADAKFTCTLCSQKLIGMQGSPQLSGQISVSEGTVDNQIISTSEEVVDSQLFCPSESIAVNDQKISSSEEIVDIKMPSEDQVLSSSETMCDILMSSSDKEIVENLITSSNIIEKGHDSATTDQQYVQCQSCNRKFTAIHISYQDEVLTNTLGISTPDLNTSNESKTSSRNSEIIKDQKAKSTNRTVPKKKLFKCKDCGKIFPYISWLHRHQTTAKHVKDVSLTNVRPDEPNSRPEEIFKITDRVEAQQEQPILPVETVPQCNESSNHACKLCDKAFNKESGLLRHLSYHSEKEAKALKQSLLQERECSNAVKESRDSPAVTNPDVPLKPKTKEYTCHICFKKMESVTKLKNHIQWAHLAKNSKLKCSLCPFRFITNTSLNNHMQIHKQPYSRKNENIINLATQLNTAGVNKMRHSYKKSKYTCKICFKSFSDSFGFQRHKSYNHNFNRQHSRGNKPVTVVQTFKCTLCQNKYHTKRGLNQHMQRFHNSTELSEQLHEEHAKKIKECIVSSDKADSEAETVKCTYCSNQYTTQRGLNQHIRQMHNNSELLEEVSVVGKNEECVATSGKEISDIETLKCTFCSYQYLTQRGLNKHIRHVHNSSELLDDVNVVGKNKEYVASSDKEISDVETFKCTFCSNRYPTQRGLSQHIRQIHNSSELLEQPQEISGVGIVKCTLCSNQYPTIRGLNQHLRRFHNISEIPDQPEDVEKNKKYVDSAGSSLQCDYCHLVFPSESALETHFQMDHLQSGIENVVSGPIVTFESAASNRNKIEAPLELNVKPELIDAVQTKKFKCKICNKLFWSEGRLHVHLFHFHQKITKDLSAYKCKYCMKQLTNAHNLKKHMTIFHADNLIFKKSNFNCDLCGRGVNTKIGLFRHMLHHRKWV